MEKIIIIALVFLWLTITLIAGYLLEAATAAIKRQQKRIHANSHAERNIMILKSTGGGKYEKMAS